MKNNKFLEVVPSSTSTNGSDGLRTTPKKRAAAKQKKRREIAKALKDVKPLKYDDEPSTTTPPQSDKATKNTNSKTEERTSIDAPTLDIQETRVEEPFVTSPSKSSSGRLPMFAIFDGYDDFFL